jgi:serine/threonine protein kinase
VKPENVMLAQDGHIKLTDFAPAKLSDVLWDTRVPSAGDFDAEAI